jgi:3-methyladenine DNA glycosylase AlkD
MTITHPLHLQILKEINKFTTDGDVKERLWVQKYLGTNKPTRCIKTGDLQKLAKKFPPNVELINSLYQNGTSFDELAVAATLAGLNKNITPNLIDNWLDYTVGWAEVDSLCQSSFDSSRLLNQWSQWKKLLNKLSQNKNIHKRRASLVLLCKSLRQSNDPRLSQLAFKLIDQLKSEKEILITKAISWILRSLTQHHFQEVAQYLDDNQNSLPRIAIRETKNKLLTGKKSAKIKL